jgi:ATP-binding cassette subfamily G (WHITE) protein 2 (SNQ2)
MFDSVILLAPGGKTCYAGPTGPGAREVSAYFGQYGAAFPPEANPAEFLIATIAPGENRWL